MQKIINWYFKAYSYLENNKFLTSIRRTLVLLVPIFMIESISLVVQYHKDIFTLKHFQKKTSLNF
ncbi:MAG: hypothetical protein ACI31I_02375 [Bacilli bacterium]